MKEKAGVMKPPMTPNTKQSIYMYSDVRPLILCMYVCSWYTYIFSLSVPLPTYILGPGSPGEVEFYQNLSADGGELCPNLTCLGEWVIVCMDTIIDAIISYNPCIYNAHNKQDIQYVYSTNIVCTYLQCVPQQGTLYYMYV